MKKLTFVLAALATIVLISSTAPTVDAAGFGLYISPGSSYPGYYASRPIYAGYGYTAGYGDSYYNDDYCVDDVRYGDVWHDTSHLHYRPTRIVRHGTHFHYEPGGYEVHRTGHWDHVEW